MPLLSAHLMESRRALPIACLLIALVIAISSVSASDTALLTSPLGSEIPAAEPLEPPAPKCPLDCSGHGTCDSATVTCFCASSWAGSGCEYPIVPLSLNTSVVGTLSRNASSPAITWNFWRSTLSSGNVLLATVTPVGCTLNLYASFQDVPATANYWAALRAQTKEVLRYDEPNYGDWTFGLAATANCSYSLNVTTVWKCPNDCSGHGTCNGQTGTCQCDKNYTILADCSQPLFPAGGDILNGSLAPLSWAYYSYTSTGNDLIVNINTTAIQPGNAAPPGAYLSASHFPTLFNYDQACASVEIGQTCSLHITKPKAGKWILGMFGAAAANCSVQFIGNNLCPNQCSGYGSCDANGVCQCPTYYNTPDCSLYQHPLTPNVPPSASILISEDQFQYFTYTSQGRTNDMTFMVNQTSAFQASLNLILFASCASAPTPFEYDYYAFCDNTTTLCSITLLKAPACAWTFAVWAKPATTPFAFNSASKMANRRMLSASHVYAHDALEANYTSIRHEQFGAINLNHHEQHQEAQRFDASNTMSQLRRADGTISEREGAKKTKTASASNASYARHYSYGQSTTAFSMSETSSQSKRSRTASSAQLEYTVALDTSIQCPNGCNGHGLCQSNGACLCDQNYGSTADCSSFVYNMVNNSAYPSQVLPGEWRFYSVFANMDNYLSFTITNLNGGMIEAYLSKHTPPTRLDYVKSISPGNQTMYQLSTTASTAPINGTWYLGVYGRDVVGTSYSVTAVADRACPAGCSLNGQCTVSGTCICNPGYVKSDCSALSVTLPANLEVQGVVRFDTWSFYNMTILGDDALEIWLRENDNLIDGLVWVFVAKDRLPTIEDHDYSNQTDSIMHTIFVPSGQTRGLWVVGVTGSPRATGSSYGRQAKYNLFATSGCGTYSSCDTCVLDPNCGWCRNQPFDPAAGRCVPGNDQTSLNQTCLFYQYSTCSLKSDMSLALAKGLIIGVSVGLFIIIAAGVTAFLLYRYYKQWEKSGLRPALLYPEQRHHNRVIGTMNAGGSPNAGQEASSSSPSGPLHPQLRNSALQQPHQQNYGSQRGQTQNTTPSNASNPDAAIISMDEDEPNLHPTMDRSASTSDASRAAPPNTAISPSYGTMGGAAPLSSDTHQPRHTEEGIYYSFGGVDAYTDSEVDSGEYSSDSEAE